MNLIDKTVFDFLQNLAQHNNREWFAAHKEHFRELENRVKAFYGDVEHLMQKHDAISGMRPYRIYRDIRFSKDKTPFKNYLAADFNRQKPAFRGGYYLHLQPENQSFAGVGFWSPERNDVLRVRKEWAADASEIKEILNKKSFKSVWGKMQGERLKSAPSGFSKEHPDINLINYKQWLFNHSFTDEEVLSPDFAQKVNQVFKSVRPFFDYMSEILTTDSNGVSVLSESEE